MNLKKVNEFFGYAHSIVGVLKIILIILVLIQINTTMSETLNGKEVSADYYPTFSTTIGFAQIILAVGSIIMIIFNKKNSEVILGYLLGLGALLIEFITPAIIFFYISFAQCGLYMKAGSKIRDKNEEKRGATKEIIKNTEWFYSDNDIKNK